MNRIILLSLFLLFSELTFAQQIKSGSSSKTKSLTFQPTDEQPPKLDSTNKSENMDYTTFTVPMQPEFPWIRGTLERYITVNLRYPESAFKNNVSGRVVVSFIVVKDGSITDVRIEKSLNPDCDKEAVRLIKSMPRWIPGDPVRYYLPIQFTLPKK